MFQPAGPGIAVGAERSHRQSEPDRCSYQTVTTIGLVREVGLQRDPGTRTFELKSTSPYASREDVTGRVYPSPIKGGIDHPGADFDRVET
jgi:hypothetical protein